MNILILSLMMIGVVMGCGPAHPAKRVEKSDLEPQVQAQEALRPWETPAQNLSLEVKGMGNPIRANSHQVYLTRVIPLPSRSNQGVRSSREILLTWKDEDLGLSILGGWASHRVLPGNNNQFENTRPISVWNDPAHQIWFVRLSELFDENEFYSTRQVTEADTQILILRLLLSNQTQISIEVQFRVSTQSFGREVQ